MKVTPPVKATTKVYLLQRKTNSGRPEPYTVHMASSVPRMAYTVVLAFGTEAHAASWAHSMEAYHVQHGSYPPRVYTKWPETMEWMQRARGTELTSLEIAEMTVADVLNMLAGSGVGCRVTLNAFQLSNKVDLRGRYSRAATVSWLCRMLQSS